MTVSASGRAWPWVWRLLARVWTQRGSGEIVSAPVRGSVDLTPWLLRWAPHPLSFSLTAPPLPVAPSSLRAKCRTQKRNVRILKGWGCFCTGRAVLPPPQPPLLPQPTPFLNPRFPCFPSLAHLGTASHPTPPPAFIPQPCPPLPLPLFPQVRAAQAHPHPTPPTLCLVLPSRLPG